MKLQNPHGGNPLPSMQPPDAVIEQRAIFHDISIVCYEDEVPWFVEAELDRLYGRRFSSLAHFRVYGGAENASTYIALDGNRTISVFLFRRDRRKVCVLNEGIELDAGAAARFANYIFCRFGTIDVIEFHAVETEIRTFPFPCIRSEYLENIVLTLPRTEQEYLGRLGKSTRSYIHRYLNKVRRQFPSFQYEVYMDGAINAQDIREIIRLSRARMADKNEIFDSDDNETQRIILLAKECGLVGVVKINGRICAGTINYRTGSNYSLEIIAHDPAFNDFRLGTLCCYLTICECIARGGKEYHFMWGQYAYKYRLLGVQRNLYNLTVYRSRAHLLLHARTVLKDAVNGGLRAIKGLLHSLQQSTGVLPRLAAHALHAARYVKRLNARSPTERK